VAATFSANMPTQQMIDVIEYERLFLLFDVEVHMRSGLKYMARGKYISSIM
jgi:hypothetical protein